MRARKNKHERIHLLVGLSGGPSSRALLHCVAQCTMGRGTKALYQVDVLHVDQSLMLGLSQAERAEQHDRLRNVVKAYGVDLEILPLEAVFTFSRQHPPQLVSQQEKADEQRTGGGATETEKEKEQLLRLFESTADLTSKEDLLVHLRNQLLSSFAARRGASWLCVGDSATRMAAEMIADTCKGRAYALPERLAFLDTRHPGVSIVRPMRDYLVQEIAIYNHFMKLETVFIPELDTKTHKFSSINHLSEGFLAGLQADFPQTIHTLMRSGDKLSLLPSDTQHYCPLCNGAMTQAEVKAASEMVKLAEPDTNLAGSSYCNSDKGCCQENEDNAKASWCSGGGCSTGQGAAEGEMEKAPEVPRLVCYGCRKLLANSDASFLPLFVKQKANTLSSSLRLRKEIQGYLLDEDEGDG